MTASLSLSVSVTVPTATATFTFSHTTSETASLSSTLSESSTFTATQTVNAISNYTAHAEPSDFVEGQDVRIRVSAYLRGDEKRALGNGSSARSLSAFAHRADFEHDCLLYAERAGPLFVTTDWGVGDADRTAADAWLHAVYFTVTAPHAAVEFVLCFREDPDEAWDVGGLGLWELLRVSSGGGEMAVLRSRESRVWYHLPDASARQYAVVRLVSGEVGWNFTHAASAACGASVQSLAGCGLGDALKLVPAGRPCTSERRQRSPLPYYGSQHLASDGGWLAAAADTLVEGSTPGGVGLFGTRLGNPLVDQWTDPGVYSPSEPPVVYVKLPEYLPGSSNMYDVCFSSRMQRAAVSGESNRTIQSVPFWRKLRPCVSDAPGECAASSGAGTAFEVKAEAVHWSLFDLTPETWGTLSVHDADAQLDTRPANASWAGYWGDAPGGDYFRLVPAEHLRESAGVSAAGEAVGSLPRAGCWWRGLDGQLGDGGHGGLAEGGVPYPAGSRDLHGDPAAAGRAGDGSDDREGVDLAFSSLWIPRAGTAWYVCYRRSCGSPTATCPGNSGLRVLPFREARGKWEHRRYHAGSGYAIEQAGAAGVLVPSEHYELPTGAGEPAYPPPRLRWAMNDTRLHTHGPLLVETGNGTGESGGVMDARPWNFAREYAAADADEGVEGDVVEDTTGSALRLVPVGSPCDWLGYAEESPPSFLENTDGGLAECDDGSDYADAPQCVGSASDSTDLFSVAYYFGFARPGEYRVCHRDRAWNWREVPFAGSSAVGLPSIVAALRGNGYFLRVDEDALESVTVTHEETRGGAEALFLVEDRQGRLAAGARRDGGDVFRLVPAGGACDVHPRGWDPALADAHLSPYCGNRTHSGLFQPPCVFDAWVRGNLAFARDAAAVTPDYYDDIVPYDAYASDLKGTAAVIRLPRGGTTTYQLCYRQAWSLSWIVFNETLAPGAWPSVRMARPSEAGELRARPLLAGAEGSFATTGSWPPGGLDRFVAKFVAHRPALANNNCLGPGAGTEGARAASRDANASRAEVTAAGGLAFTLLAPAAPGAYLLCLRSSVAMSWYVPRSGSKQYTYEVTDAGIRWWVAALNVPYNDGTVQIHFAATSREATLNTADDEVKLVLTTQTCETSESAAIVTGLGPRQGFVRAASIQARLPPSEGRVRVQYKVCLRSHFLGGSSRWAEIQQLSPAEHTVATSGVGTVTDASGLPGFMTHVSPVLTWHVSDDLRLSSQSPALAAGKLTLSVGSLLTPPVASFTLQTAASFPSLWNARSLDFRFASKNNSLGCASPGHPTVFTAQYALASLEMHITTHLPTEPGDYLVCVREHVSSTSWVQLASDAAGYVLSVASPLLYSGVRKPAGARDAVVQLFDWRAAAWCAPPTKNCSHEGYTHDLLSVRPKRTLCLPPTSAPLGSNVGEPDWYLLRGSPSIPEVTSTLSRVVLPPAGVDDVEFRICVFKLHGSNGSIEPGMYQVPLIDTFNDVWVDDETYTRAVEVRQILLQINTSTVAGHNIPVIASDAAVTYVVKVVNSRLGDVVFVQRCREYVDSSSELDTECLQYDPPESEASFELHNDDAACPLSTDWESPAHGLAARVDSAGEVAFVLSARTACPEQGCGVRFTVGSPAVYTTAPYFHTVQRLQPTGLSINGTTLSSLVHGQSASCGGDQAVCVVLRCTSGVVCVVVAQAMRGSFPLAAVEGSVRAEWSFEDGALFANRPSSAAVSWDKHGVVTLSPLFTLAHPDAEGRARLRLALSSSSWGSAEVVVTEPTPAHVDALSLVPHDPSVPLYPYTMSRDALGVTLEYGDEAPLHAGERYNLSYRLSDPRGVPLPWPLPGGVAFSARLDLLPADAPRNGVEAALFGTGGGGALGVSFAVRSNAGCTRVVGGCRLVFEWSDAAAGTVAAVTVRFTARVVGTTTQVSVEGGAAAAGTNAEGLPLLVEVGEHCGAGCWLSDEYHFGDVFTVLRRPWADDGIATSGGFRLVTAEDADSPLERTYHPFSWRQATSQWAARFTLRGSRSCHACELSVHTTWGASPSETSGMLTFTLTDGGITLQCAFETPAGDPSNAVAQAFAVSTATAEPVLFPRWPVTFTLHWGAPSQVSSATYTASLGPKGVVSVSALLFGDAFMAQLAPSCPVVANLSELTLVVNATVRSTETVGLLTYTGTAAVQRTYTCDDAAPSSALGLSSPDMALDPGQAGRYSFQTTTNALQSSVRLHVNVAGTAQLVQGSLRVVAGEGTAERALPVRVVVASSWADRQLHPDVTYGAVALGVSEASSSAAGAVLVLSADEAVVRDALFSVCATISSPANRTVCGLASLTVAPASVAGTAAYFVLPPVTPSDPPTSLHPGGRSCRTNPSVLRLAVSAYHPVINSQGIVVKYQSYGVPLRYTLSVEGQVLEATESDASEQLDGSLVKDGEDTSDGAVEFVFTGLHPTEVPARFIVRASAPMRTGFAVAPAESSAVYQWVLGEAEVCSDWDVLDAVSHGPCAGKNEWSAGPSSADHYAEEAAGYPVGWEYAAGGYASIAFPVQAVVKNAAGTRAWGYNEGSLRVVPAEFSGCGAAANVTVLTRAEPESDLRETGGATIPFVDGIATAWVMYHAPCERCTLRFDFCYSARSAPDGCLVPTDAGRDPFTAKRVKFTKPFSIKPALGADTAHVTSQALPGARSTAVVGEPFDLELAAVKLFGPRRWASPPLEHEVLAAVVSSRYVRGGAHLKYGVGGFIAGLDPDNPGFACGSGGERGEARGVDLSRSDTSRLALRFAFTRPCGACEVWVRYRVGRAGGDWVAFRVRDWATREPATVRVAACGVRWGVVGGGWGAKWARRPFTVAALRVDVNGQPSFDGDSQRTPLSLTLPAAGSRGCGELVLQSPAGAFEPVPNANLSADTFSRTIQLKTSLPGFMFATFTCFTSCPQVTIAVGEAQTLTFPIFSRPTQVVAIPRGPTVLRKQAGAQAAATVNLDVYAADDEHNRGHLLGGPTEPSAQPAFSGAKEGGVEGRPFTLVPGRRQGQSVGFHDPLGGARGGWVTDFVGRASFPDAEAVVFWDGTAVQGARAEGVGSLAIGVGGAGGAVDVELGGAGLRPAGVVVGVGGQPAVLAASVVEAGLSIAGGGTAGFSAFVLDSDLHVCDVDATVSLQSVTCATPACNAQIPALLTASSTPTTRGASSVALTVIDFDVDPCVCTVTLTHGDTGLSVTIPVQVARPAGLTWTWLEPPVPVAAPNASFALELAVSETGSGAPLRPYLRPPVAVAVEARPPGCFACSRLELLAAPDSTISEGCDWRADDRGVLLITGVFRNSFVVRTINETEAGLAVSGTGWLSVVKQGGTAFRGTQFVAHVLRDAAVVGGRVRVAVGTPPLPWDLRATLDCGGGGRAAAPSRIAGATDAWEFAFTAAAAGVHRCAVLVWGAPYHDADPYRLDVDDDLVVVPTVETIRVERYDHEIGAFSAHVEGTRWVAGYPVLLRVRLLDGAGAPFFIPPALRAAGNATYPVTIQSHTIPCVEDQRAAFRYSCASVDGVLLGLCDAGAQPKDAGGGCVDSHWGLQTIFVDAGSPSGSSAVVSVVYRREDDVSVTGIRVTAGRALAVLNFELQSIRRVEVTCRYNGAGAGPCEFALGRPVASDREFELSVRLLDGDNATVEGDSYSEVRVRVSCNSTPGDGHLAVVGGLGGIEEQTEEWVGVPIRKGAGAVGRAVLRGACRAAVLEARCAVLTGAYPGLSDTLRSCGRAALVAPFSFGPDGNATDAPPATPAPAQVYPVITVLCSGVGFDSFDAGEFEGKMTVDLLTVVRQGYARIVSLCRLPDPVLGPVSVVDRSNTTRCKRFRAISSRSVRLARGRPLEADVLTVEFQVISQSNVSAVQAAVSSLLSASSSLVRASFPGLAAAAHFEAPIAPQPVSPAPPTLPPITFVPVPVNENFTAPRSPDGEPDDGDPYGVAPMSAAHHCEVSWLGPAIV
eukprot:gene1055-1627_t